MSRIRKQRHGAVVDGPSASTKASATSQANGSVRHHEHLALQERGRRLKHGLSERVMKKAT